MGQSVHALLQLTVSGYKYWVSPGLPSGVSLIHYGLYLSANWWRVSLQLYFFIRVNIIFMSFLWLKVTQYIYSSILTYFDIFATLLHYIQDVNIVLFTPQHVFNTYSY